MKPEDLPSESQPNDNPTQERNRDNDNDHRRSDADCPVPESAADTQPSSNPNEDIQSLCPSVTVRVYARHSLRCPKRHDSQWRGCNCPKWLYVNNDGKDRRVSAKTRSWARAEQTRRAFEDSFDPIRAEIKRKQLDEVTLVNAIASYLGDVGTRSVSPVTLRRCRLILEKQLVPWCERNAIRFLQDLTTARLSAWRSESWNGVAPITRQTRQQRLSNFFEFCVRQDWLPHNPARRLTPIRVKACPTNYFTREQFEKLIEATFEMEKSWRRKSSRGPHLERTLRSLLLLMRWAGLRLGDAVRFQRSQLVGDRVLLYQAKTGEPVSVLLPPQTAKYLRETPAQGGEHARFFFCRGDSDSIPAVARWARVFRRLFKLAEIKNSDGTLKRCHCHMLRDTCAIEALLAGVPIDLVSVILGHSNIKTTLKHYSPWVRARQQQLDEVVKKTHLVRGITKYLSGGLTGAASTGGGVPSRVDAVSEKARKTKEPNLKRRSRESVAGKNSKKNRVRNGKKAA